MNYKTLLFLVGMGLVSGCTVPPATSSAGGSDYVPAFTRVAKGYRPTVPFYYPVVTYVHSQAFTPEQVHEMQQDFSRPLVTGVYRSLIGAVVLDGAPQASDITFSIWLLDGRKLDSGKLAASDTASKDIGRQFYRRGVAMLQEAIPAEKLRAAQATEPGAIGGEPVRPESMTPRYID